MSVTAVCVRPLGTDLVALSAFDTLVRKMGYADSLVSLSREEVWLLGLDLDDEKASGVTKMLVEETGIFVNPNTHTHTIVRPDEMLPRGRQCGGEELEIAVWSREDPQAGPVATAVRERMRILSLLELRRLSLWRPRFQADEGEEGKGERDGSDGRKGRNVREIASSMVATRSRKEGLLANPHCQCWIIVEGALKPHELLRTVCEVEEPWPRNSC
ncbi:MAG: hypothetical protein NTX17_04725 [Candidatus Eisenbacteria bacterium]|nr:hypothetical protein [Candidatus Eisenbacteria bacterium]